MCAWIIVNSVPEAPSGVKGNTMDKTSVLLTWNPPTNPNGVLLDYQILYHGYELKEQETTRVSNDMHSLYHVIIPVCMAPGIVIVIICIYIIVHNFYACSNCNSCSTVFLK